MLAERIPDSDVEPPQGMQFRLLGPLEVRTPEGWAAISAAKWRLLLACLLLRPGELVRTETLISELWGCPAEHCQQPGQHLRTPAQEDDRGYRWPGACVPQTWLPAAAS